MVAGLALTLLAACGGDDGGSAAEASTSTRDDTVADYCRLMERTEEVLQSDEINPTQLQAAVRAEQERIENSPPDLEDEWATYAAGGAPVAVADRIKDWTQEHCGFLPTVG